MNIDQTFELPYGDEYPKPIFARYNLNRIEVKRTRKRAIERARHKTRSKMIEVGDMVQVGESTYGYGHDVGTIGIVSEVRDWVDWVDVTVSVYLEHIDHLSNRSYRIEDVKLVKKGSN